MENYKRLNADIVVVGGGIAGMVAAIRAKELLPAGKVLVVDKGKASRSGCANWAGGDITFTLPDDNISELVDRYMLSGDGLADPDWIRFALVETYPRVLDMVRYGVPFERDIAGNLLRKGGRGGGALSVISQGAAILKGLRQAAEKIGVVFADKTMVTDLIGDKEGIANGVLGFKVGTEKVVPFVLAGKAIILLSGPVSFKAAYIGHRMCTGEGLAMAYRHGAEFMGMEFASGHNAGPRSFDLSGMARFVAMGGRFLNAKDEEFMVRYDPALKNQANWNTLNLAMAVEIQEGKGPIYFDLTAMRPEDIELSKKILPHTFLALERMHIDITREKIEWIPCLAGNRSSGAGIRLSSDMSTAIPGVFSGGDSGGKYHYGANAGYHGMNIGWCAISGYRAALSAVKWINEKNSTDPSKEAVMQGLEGLLRPINSRDGMSPDEVIAVMQQNIIPYDIIILKHRNRLKIAIKNLEALEREEIKARDNHELMKAHEAVSMVTAALMILKASLLREESRGTHHREDFPQRDDLHWKRWLYLKKAGERTEFWTETKDGTKNLLGKF